jgi:hypothetical protein
LGGCDKEDELFLKEVGISRETINRCLRKSKVARHWWLMPIILTTGETDIRRISGQSVQKKKILAQKYSTQKGAGGRTQVIECLPSKCELLPVHLQLSHMSETTEN